MMGKLGERSTAERLNSAEKAKVVKLRGIQNSDLVRIAEWAADPETHNHLKFLPEPPEPPRDPKNELQVERYEEEYKEYVGKFENIYNNDGEPLKITPMVGVNLMLEPISVVTIRWRGSPYAPKDKKIASIETFIVDPNLRGGGAGTETLSAALDVAFDRYVGYAGREGAREVRAWIFTDPKAGDYTRNINLFQRFGFRNLPGNWKEYAEKRNIPNEEGRNAQWFQLTREEWDRLKKEQPELVDHAPIDLNNLRGDIRI